MLKLSIALAALPLAAAPVVVTAPTQASAPMCHNRDLRTSYVYSDSGMSHRYGWIMMRNRSAHTCTVFGFPGVSYVGDGNGTQIGAPAVRVGPRPRTVTLAPGLRARAAISEVNVQVYDARVCRPHRVDGFRVYVPGSFLAQYIPHRTMGCANPRVHTLEIKAATR